MLTLVDTSIWIAHLRSPHQELIALLENGNAATHTAVIGELACGSLKKRTVFLESLNRLLPVTEADPEEVHELIENKKLFGKGIGWVDAQLLASCLISNTHLITLDKKLAAIASKLL